MFSIKPKRSQERNLTTEVIPLMYSQDKSSTLRSTSSPQYERREDIANVRRYLV